MGTFTLISLLLANLLRTILSDPGYFPSALDLEYQIVMKNLINQEENNKDINALEREKTAEEEEDVTKDFEKNLSENYNYNITEEKKFNDKKNKNSEKNFEKKKGFFKVELNSKDRPKKNQNKKTPIEKTYYEQENSIEMYKEDSLNLLNF